MALGLLFSGSVGMGCVSIEWLPPCRLRFLSLLVPYAFRAPGTGPPWPSARRQGDVRVTPVWRQGDVRVTPLPGQPGAGPLPGAGPTSGPFSSLLTGPQPSTGAKGTRGKEASWHSGCPGGPGWVWMLGYQSLFPGRGTRSACPGLLGPAPLTLARSAGARRVPCLLEKSVCQKVSGLSHSSRPTLPVLQAKQIQRFSNILCPCFCQIFFYLRVYKRSQICLDIAV